MENITIVIPAYNESKRLPKFLSQLVNYCKKDSNQYAVIVVDDGSRDDTYEKAVEFKSQFENLRVLKLKKNRGKGYAVKRGLFAAKSKIVLFMDADGSTPPEEIGAHLHYFDEGYDIIIGSRALRQKGKLTKTRLHRKIMGLVFNFMVHSILFKNIHDTQCGFKMFKKEVVKPIFSRMYLRGFGFDIELLYLAFKMGYKIKEVPVSWVHKKGSKVNLIKDSIIMFFNILQIRNWHFTPVNPSIKYMGLDEYRYMYDMERYHWWFVSRNNFMLRLIRTLNKSINNILDAGCGTGINLQSLSQFGTSFGIDISEQAIKFCKKRGLTRLMKCPVENIECQSRFFDLVTCLDVLEHVEDPVRVLKELKRVLKDDGRIIIMVPAFRSLWSQHDDALCHLRRYNSMDLDEDIIEAGLRTEKMGYFLFTSFLAVAPIRIIRRFFMSGKKAKSDTTTLPPRFLNDFLKFLFKMEMKVAIRLGLPFGTTLYAVVSK